jgi:hypothetical protein
MPKPLVIPASTGLEKRPVKGLRPETLPGFDGALFAVQFANHPLEVDLFVPELTQEDGLVGANLLHLCLLALLSSLESLDLDD